MYSHCNGQSAVPQPSLVQHSQVERTLLRHLQALCRIDPNTSFDDTVHLVEKIKGTLEREVDKISTATKGFRDKYLAEEPGSQDTEEFLKLELYKFQHLAQKHKANYFWQRNPNFMERVKQNNYQPKREGGGGSRAIMTANDQQNQSRTVMPNGERQVEEEKPQHYGGPQQNEPVVYLYDGYQQTQQGYGQSKPMEMTLPLQNGEQRQVLQQGQKGAFQLGHPAQRQAIHPSQRAALQPLQPSEPVIITLDSDAESPPSTAVYHPIIMPVPNQQPVTMGMAKKKFPVKRAAPRGYSNPKQQAMTARNYSAVNHPPGQAAPVKYRVVTNLSYPPSGVHQAQGNGMNLMERRENLQNMASQEPVQQQRAKPIKYASGRQGQMEPSAPALPPPLAQQNTVTDFYEDANQEHCQDIDVDPEELAKSFFQ